MIFKLLTAVSNWNRCQCCRSRYRWKFPLTCDCTTPLWLALQVNIRRATPAPVPAAVQDYTRRQVQVPVPSAALVSTRQRTLAHVSPVLQDSLAVLARRVAQTVSSDSTV